MKDFSSRSANSHRSLTFTVLSSSDSKITRSRSLTNLHTQLSFHESFAVVESTPRSATMQEQQQLFDFADFDAFVACQNHQKKGRNSTTTSSTWDLNDDLCDKSCASIQTRETLLMEETSDLSNSDLWAGVHAEVSPRVVHRDCFGFPIYDLQADTPPPPPPSAPAESAPMTPEEAEKAARRARRRRSAATKRKGDSAIPRHSQWQAQAAAAASSSCSPPMRMRRSLSSGGISCATLREDTNCPALLSPTKPAKNSSREHNRNGSPVALSPPKPASNVNGSHSRPRRNKSLGDGGITSQLVEVEAKSSKRKHQAFPKTKGGSHHIPNPPPTTARRRKSLGHGGLMKMAVTRTMMPESVKGKCHTIPTPPTTTSTKATPRRRRSLGDGGISALMQDESLSSSARRRRGENLNNSDPHRRRSRSRNSSLRKSFNESTEIAAAMAAAAVAAAMSDQSATVTPAERRRARRTSGSGDDNPGTPLKKFGRSRRSSAPMALLEATADRLLDKPSALKAIC